AESRQKRKGRKKKKAPAAIRGRLMLNVRLRRHFFRIAQPGKTSHSFEERCRKITLGERGNDDYNILAAEFRPRADFECGGNRRARGDSDGNTFEPGHFAGRIERG